MARLSTVLLKWYDLNKRDLPWRSTTNPYLVWLSEIILQQTRIEQGLSYYENFRKAFPTINELASASEDTVLRLWQGLGYYSRARNLHFTAKYIVNELEGVFPSKYDEIIQLKGVGDYTASAIASFSFKEVQPVLDGNVFRFISRYYNIKDDIAASKSREIFKRVLFKEIDVKNPDVFNQAIMDFGSVWCSPKSPKCENCPFNDNCIAFKQGTQDQLPVKLKKIKRRSRYFNYYVITDGENYVLNKRPNSGIWAGLYEFPLLESKGKQEFFDQNNDLLSGLDVINVRNFEPGKKHVLSHQDIFTQFFLITVEELKIKPIYDINQVNTLPKPILIENFLKENVYK